MGRVKIRRSLSVIAATAIVTGLLVTVAPVASAKTVVSISTGENHTCAVTTVGGVWCWGDNTFGQLGDGTTDDRTGPVQVLGLASGVESVAAGGNHTCALTAAGGVTCWGWNEKGQVGDDTTTDRSSPVDVVGLMSDVVAIAAGSIHSCALTTDGGVKCWGENGSGALGDGTNVDRHAPVDVEGLASGVTQITAGRWFTCAVTTDGGVGCWGRYDSLTPVAVPGLEAGVGAVSAGSLHGCVLTVDGGVRCWGDDVWGQRGDGPTRSDLLPPTDVVGLTTGVASISLGSVHTCAVTEGRRATCWGRNASGQLGDASTIDRSTPVEVAGLWVPVVAVSAGGAHTCVLTAGGGVLCWGANDDGQLGDGSTTGGSTPVAVSGLAGTSVTPRCSALLERTGSAYRTLSAAIRAARDGDVVRIEGVCVGSTSIDGKRLVLEGIATLDAPIPVLSGDQLDRVLTITDAAVTIDDLTLAFGAAQAGGVIHQVRGRLSLRGDTRVLWGTAPLGGGIWTSHGSLSLGGAATIRGCTAGGIYSQGSTVSLAGRAAVEGNDGPDGARGGGIYNDGGIVTLQDGAGVANNSLGDGSRGGGIYNGGGTVTLTDSSSVGANSTGESSQGTSIFNEAGTVSMHRRSSVSADLPGAYRASAIANLEGLLLLDGSSLVDGTTRLGESFPTGIDNRRGTVVMGGGASVTAFGAAIVNDAGRVRLGDEASLRDNDGIGIANHSGKIALRGAATIQGNWSQRGGGIHNESGTVSLFGSASVVGNSGSRNGGGIWNGQRGVVALHGSSSVRQNAAWRLGGGIRNVAGGVVALYDSATVRRNRSKIGGGIYNGRHASLYLYGAASVVLNTARRGQHGGVGGGRVFLCSDTVALSPNDPDDPPATSPCPATPRVTVSRVLGEVANGARGGTARASGLSPSRRPPRGRRR